MKRSIRIIIARRLSRWVNAIQKDRYHPERYYMRGPGPATARKQSGAARDMPSGL